METKISEIFLTREHIINHLKSDAGDLMNAYSIREDSIIFTRYISDKKKDIYGRDTAEYLNDDINDIKSKWLKYSRLIFNDLNFIKFKYKSVEYSKICEVSVYRNGHFKYSKKFSCMLQAEAQAYIYEFSNNTMMSRNRLAKRINKVLELHLKAYNYINNDDAKFIINLGFLSVQSKSLNYLFKSFLFSALIDDKILRSYKIYSLLNN